MEKEEIRIKQRYKIEKVLGQGGFGVTYLAYDEELCQEVVLKKYRWEHGSLDNEVINKRDYYKKKMVRLSYLILVQQGNMQKKKQ